MKNEFALAFNEVIEEKQLPREVILRALETAIVSAYRRDVNASNAQHVEATIDPDTGRVMIFAEKEVVEKVNDERTEVSLLEAQQVDPNVQLGGMVVVESTPRNFGRVAAQTARQVIQQRIREAERETQTNFFSKQQGDIVSGVIQAVTPQGVTLGLDMKAEGSLPRNQQIPGERFRVHDRIQALLMEVKDSPRGPQIILSRAHRNFLRRLLENEVPEIYHGLVDVRSIAREPGQRSKVAVSALQPAVDPVGACVGIRGVRIQAIVRELNDEKIDVIEWSADPSVYIAKALSPARVTGVYLNDQSKGAKTATVVVPEDQLSLAIGRDGQNARLAAKLTAWRIDIKSLPEAATDALHKLQSDSGYEFLRQHESDTMPQVEAILAKKAEGRAVPPEEYQVLSQFVDRVERGYIRQRSVERRAEDKQYAELRATIPPQAFQVFLEDMPLSPRVFNLLSEAGYDSAGSLMLQLKIEPDAILALGGIGPKAMDEIKSILTTLEFPEPLQEVVEPTPVEEAQPPVIEPVETVVAEVVEPTQPEEVLATGETTAAVIAEEGQPAAADLTPSGEAEQIVEIGGMQPETVKETEESEYDRLFQLRPEIFGREEGDEEEDEEFLSKKGKRDKKKKRKNVEMEFDPERNEIVVKRIRKRGGTWEDNWTE